MVTVDVVASIIAFLLTAIMQLITCVYFYKGYKRSKETGFKNDFFFGNAVLFGFFTLMNLILSFYVIPEWTDGTLIDGSKIHFSWYESPTDPFLELFNNQMRPRFLIFYFMLTLVFAAQVYPLEKIVGLEKTPFTKAMLVLGSLVWILWIPPLCNTYVGPIVVLASWASLLLGIILNVGVNLKLSIKSAGDLKKQSLIALFAFVLIVFGLIVSLEVGLIPGLSYHWESAIGCVIEIIAIFLYRKAFIVHTEDV